MRVSLVDAALVPIVHLLNGATVARVPMDAVEYWHVELDRHDLLLANNLPAESYLDMNNRDFFIERGIRPYVPTEPVHPFLYAGSMVELARTQLRARAERLGWTEDRHPDPRLIVDGVERRAMIVDDVVQFELPASADSVRLVSTTFVPADLQSGVDDTRRLGLSIRSMQVIGAGGSEAIALDDPRLEYPYPVESNGEVTWRWTAGELHLPKSLWSHCRGETIRLHLCCDMGARRGYLPPPDKASATAAPPKAPRYATVDAG